MDIKTKRMWMVRAGQKAVIVDKFLNKNIVAIGWDLGDLSTTSSKSELTKKLREFYPNWTIGKISMATGQMEKFRLIMKIGDYVVTYNPDKRAYHVGEIAGEYVYAPNEIREFPNTRKVKWIGKVDRDKLSLPTKNTVGAISTIFGFSYEAQEEFLVSLKEDSISNEIDVEKEEYDEFKQNKIEDANEFIKDRLSKLDWEAMQDLVAGVLRAMGYKTRVSPKGADRGKDILASPDGLGLEDPRIVVEVKHRAGQMGAPEVRSFTGGLRTGHKGIYVSTGGFSKEAKYEADRSKEPVTLIDMDDLVDLITQYYDNFDSEAKTILPLLKLYWPL